MIAEILYGTKKTRIGGAPTTEELTDMMGRIARFVAVGAPVEIITLWGATKGYGLDPNRLGVDIADLLGLRRYACLNAMVKEVYPPGLLVRIIREDISEWVLTSDTTGLDTKIKLYVGQLAALCLVMGQGQHITVEGESDILGRLGITPAQFDSLGQRNTDRFLAYWDASASVAEQDRSSLPEHNALVGLGWNGTIPDATRGYYIDRASTEHQGASRRTLIGKVCRYFGNALARYQVGLYGGRFRDRAGDITPLKASFVPYPPGTPVLQRKGRLEYKVKDSKNSNNTIPPWCGFGFLTQTQEGFEPTIVGVRHCCNYDVEPVEVVLGESGTSCSIRSDIAHPRSYATSSIQTAMIA